MCAKKNHQKDYMNAKYYSNLTTGEVIKMLRGLKGWTATELARESGININNISLLENNKVDIGKRRAIALAKAFGVHPAIIMFPEYGTGMIEKAA